MTLTNINVCYARFYIFDSICCSDCFRGVEHLNSLWQGKCGNAPGNVAVTALQVYVWTKLYASSIDDLEHRRNGLGMITYRRQFCSDALLFSILDQLYNVGRFCKNRLIFFEKREDVERIQNLQLSIPDIRATFNSENLDPVDDPWLHKINDNVLFQNVIL